MEFIEILRTLINGFGNTVLLFAITLIASLPLGLLIAFGSMSKFLPLKGFCKGLVWIIRGTPLLLQVLLVTLVPWYVFGIGNTTIMSFLGVKMKTLLFSYACIAFIVNYACYFSEIFRGAIEGVPKSQFEAGKVLGMKKGQIFSKIILFQVIKKSLAPVSNEVITLVKDTSLAYTLSVIEMFTLTKQIAAAETSMMPFVVAGIFYYIFNLVVAVTFEYIEKKLGYYR